MSMIGLTEVDGYLMADPGLRYLLLHGSSLVLLNADILLLEWDFALVLVRPRGFEKAATITPTAT
jgi:hypothetical protein